mgnify:CR=1 FL=1
MVKGSNFSWVFIVGENELVGQSAAMRDVRRLIDIAAPAKTTILVLGATGTGKELVARSIHKFSARKGDLISINCSAIPAELLESELFGYEKGAFTGAHNDSKGLLKAAENGTLFLDEVACLSSSTQAKLLRVLQEKQFYPVGDVQLQTFSASVISASNLRLEDAIEQQQFREDLRYRLEVIPLLVPSLRERKDDIILLFEYFLNQSSANKNWKIGSELKDNLVNYSWPGNIRELENCAKFTAAMSNSGQLELSNLPDSIQTALKKDIPEQLISDEVKKITQALIQNCSNKTKTAKQLGISRMTLWRKMQTHNL